MCMYIHWYVYGFQFLSLLLWWAVLLWTIWFKGLYLYLIFLTLSLLQNCEQLVQTVADTGVIMREIRELEDQVRQGVNSVICLISKDNRIVLQTIDKTYTNKCMYRYIHEKGLMGTNIMMNQHIYICTCL